MVLFTLAVDHPSQRGRRDGESGSNSEIRRFEAGGKSDF
jgi:hypothetical protein